MSKKEYNLEEYEEFYKKTKQRVGDLKSKLQDKKLIGRCNESLKKLEEQYNEVLFAKPGSVLEFDEIRIIVK